jgi:periplasmic divalent cation tolerance protein
VTLAQNRVVLALVTAPELRTARKLAKAALEHRLVACANLVPGVESHYWWRGKIAKSKEALLLFKTAPSKLQLLEELIVAKHPYDTPEFIVLYVKAGNRRYLDWVHDSVEVKANSKRSARAR